jgi:hypothetical protein
MTDSPEIGKNSRDRAHAEVRAAMNKAGAADLFYCGVTVDGYDFCGFTIGRRGSLEYSNIERMQRLLGILEINKHALIKGMDDVTTYDVESEDP